jgi:hypothetical protein
VSPAVLLEYHPKIKYLRIQPRMSSRRSTHLYRLFNF